MKLETAMELLDFESVDPLARRLAIWHLQTLSVSELKTFTVQLVQCIKFERSLTLIQYLIQRAISNFKDFGYDIYWALKSEARHSMCNVQLF